MMRRGLNISINSDDPPFLYGANLIDNYLAIADAFQLTPDDIIDLVRNGFASSFRGAKHLKQLDSWLADRSLP